MAETHPAPVTFLFRDGTSTVALLTYEGRRALLREMGLLRRFRLPTNQVAVALTARKKRKKRRPT
jgi:hypothetical protein